MQIGLYAARFVFAAVAVAAPWVAQAANKGKTFGSAQLERGNYLVRIGGCNDCHTPGYFASNGKVPEKDWLTGDRLGWRGPWGTTYASNLRMYMQSLSEEQWLKKAKSLKTRPPMPWFTVQQMNSADLRAIHAYIRHLGPGGEPAPAYVPPGKEPSPPFVQFPAPPK